MGSYCLILNQMVQYIASHQPTRVDASFAALSDATRRGVLETILCEDASISDLAQKFDMTLTGMKKHVSLLEKAGLVVTEKVGRVRTCRPGTCQLEAEAAWIAGYHRMWAARLDALDAVVEDLKQQEIADGHRKD